MPADAPTTLEWDRYVGALSYLVTESPDDFVTTKSYDIPVTTFKIPHRVSEVQKFSYRVETRFESDQVIDGVCRGAVELTMQPDPEFRRMTRKVIVPIVGSTVGATGAKFRTSLRITSNAGQQRGRIVFHPAGQASDSDPSMPYVFDHIKETFAWDDIVETLGASGIGSLDIIPDDKSEPAAPTVLARHYTDASTGTFGSFEPAVLPFDFLSPRVLHARRARSAFPPQPRISHAERRHDVGADVRQHRTCEDPEDVSVSGRLLHARPGVAVRRRARSGGDVDAHLQRQRDSVLHADGKRDERSGGGDSGVPRARGSFSDP